MKKRFTLLLVSVLVLSFLIVSPAAARTSWTGDPDPMACNAFGDCFWVTPVCIEGNTYDIGIYYNPEGVSPETIAADALNWSETVLTSGACEVVSHNVVYIPHFDLFLSREGFGVVGPNSSGLMETVQYCTLESSTSGPVSVEKIAEKCLVGDKAGAGVSALPADLTNPTCSAPVKAPSNLGPGVDMKGTWACDWMLKNIPTAVDGVTVNGSRYPLFSSNPAAQKQTLWYVYAHSPWLVVP